MVVTSSVTQSVRRVLQMSWENTSCPSWVVPSRGVHDGRRFGGNADAWGSYGATSPGNTARSTITSRMIAPATALRLPRTARRKRCGGAARSSVAPGASVPSMSAEKPVATSGLARAGIEHRRDEIREQHADKYSERVEEEQPLHQG